MGRLLIKLCNDAVDVVRREEVKDHPELKHTRYFWIRNHDKNLERLNPDLQAKWFSLIRKDLKTVDAF